MAATRTLAAPRVVIGVAAAVAVAQNTTPVAPYASATTDAWWRQFPVRLLTVRAGESVRSWAVVIAAIHPRESVVIGRPLAPLPYAWQKKTTP